MIGCYTVSLISSQTIKVYIKGWGVTSGVNICPLSPEHMLARISKLPKMSHLLKVMTEK